MARRPTPPNGPCGQHLESIGPTLQAEEEGHEARRQEENPTEALTCIHRGIHSHATHDTPEETSELDQIDIDNFIRTLAQVALAVTQRRIHQAQDSGELTA